MQSILTHDDDGQLAFALQLVGAIEPNAPMKDDYDVPSDEESSCDLETDGGVQRRPYCFLCDLPKRGDPTLSITETQLRALHELLTKDVGRCAPIYIARNVHRYYMREIVAPARANNGQRYRIWRTRDVLRHMREHSRDARHSRDRDIRLIGRLIDALSREMRLVEATPALLQYARTLRMLIELEHKLYLLPLNDELDALDGATTAAAAVASSGSSATGTWTLN